MRSTVGGFSIALGLASRSLTDSPDGLAFGADCESSRAPSVTPVGTAGLEMSGAVDGLAGFNRASIKLTDSSGFKTFGTVCVRMTAASVAPVVLARPGMIEAIVGSFVGRRERDVASIQPTNSVGKRFRAWKRVRAWKRFRAWSGFQA